MVHGSGFRVQGSGFRVQGSGFGVQGSGFGVPGTPDRCGLSAQEDREAGCSRLISQRVFIESFCKSQFPQKFVNLFFILVRIKD